MNDAPIKEPASATDAGVDGKAEAASDPSTLPPEILDRVPPEVRQMVREVGFFASGPVPNPIAKQVKPEHIGKLLDYNEEESKRNFALRKQGRLFGAFYVLCAIAVFFGLAWMFGRSDPELFKLILTYAATFGAGFAGGWGVKAARSGQDE